MHPSGTLILKSSDFSIFATAPPPSRRYTFCVAVVKMLLKSQYNESRRDGQGDVAYKQRQELQEDGLILVSSLVGSFGGCRRFIDTY